MDITEAKEIFNIFTEKWTLQNLKSAYRKIAFVVHPDVGGTGEQFQKLKDAYDLLKGFCTNEITELDCTIEGYELSELGKGYPVTVNAKECSICNGYGYKKYHRKETIYDKCPDCEGTGIYFVKCRICSGLGHFRHPRTNKNVGTCETCQGTGKFYPPFNPKSRNIYNDLFGVSWILVILPNGQRVKANNCRKCNGMKEVLIDKEVETLYYSYCIACDGKGEIKMWNPVIPRGLFQNN